MLLSIITKAKNIHHAWDVLGVVIYVLIYSPWWQFQCVRKMESWSDLQPSIRNGVKSPVCAIQRTGKDLGTLHWSIVKWTTDRDCNLDCNLDCKKKDCNLDYIPFRNCCSRTFSSFVYHVFKCNFCDIEIGTYNL